ncbi:unnamed protein product, partial [Vitis vinifera]
MDGVNQEKLRFCIDRGGTFTDVYAEIPGQSDGRVMKLLSVDPSNYDDAPIEGIRRILEEFTGESIPRTSKIPTDRIEWIRMGTTVATNALLERKGERIALCVTQGFKDLLQIGNQARPRIFDLTVSKPSNLYEEVIEVEERIELLLRYLSGFISRFDEGLGKVNVLFMQSDGGLAPESRFSGHKAVLSGPAGGVVGYSQTLFGLETEKPLIGFDMGGTSTDVSRYAGSYEQVLETQIAGAIIQAPQLDINTVAAGGELAVTDANLILGFLAKQINSYRKSQDPSAKDMMVEEIALGFVNVANETMCRPIRQLTEMKGHETRNHALACFGGAGPQHACAIARSLGMKEVLIHRFCGILSAYGMGLADVIEEAQEPYSAVYDTAIMVKRQLNEDGVGCDYAIEFLENLGYGHVMPGPAIIMNGNSTVIVEPNCKAVITKYGNIKIEIQSNLGTVKVAEKVADVVQLSIFNHRFMGIAEQMGRTLQRTSISTNIKERLDFSCALFGPDGGLVANAPHVPVHLGAMSSTVRWQLKYWGNNLNEGDVLVTNHPCAGGSHLPDITVVTPVFNNGKLVFFVASRGHHAEIGGITPGSMPPFSKSIWEEGAAIKAFKLVDKGIFQEEGIIKLLQFPNSDESAHNIPGTRRLQDNLSDLQAQSVAARDYMDDAAAVIYCIRCLVDVDIPLNQGFTDVVLTAFQACACSQGCMNNLTFGDDTFGYYETIGGGCGAGPSWDGTSGVQCHMTNTRMTDPEIFEQRYPVILHTFGLRENSGGAGLHRGGDGLVREIEFRRPVVVSILSERRVHAPRGLKGGKDGARGANYLITKDKREVYLGGKNTVAVQAGEILRILTPGGGGWGSLF